MEIIGNIRHIIIIQSLKSGEAETGKDLYEDCVKRRIDYMQHEKIKMTHKFFDINSKTELIEILKYYDVNSEYMHGGILIHFEMHGDDKQGGVVLSNNEFVKWSELIPYFRQINIKCKNKLFLTLATCYGRFLYKGIDPYLKSPYSGYISASKTVLPNEIAEKFNLLFEKLIESGNIIYAYTEMEKAESNFYYKDLESIFEESFKDSIEKLKADPEFWKEILENAKKIARETGAPELTKEVQDSVFKQVCKDLYEKQKSAFNFNE